MFSFSVCYSHAVSLYWSNTVVCLRAIHFSQIIIICTEKNNNIDKVIADMESDKESRLIIQKAEEAKDSAYI